LYRIKKQCFGQDARPAALRGRQKTRFASLMRMRPLVNEHEIKNLTLLTNWPLMRNNFLHGLPAKKNGRQGAGVSPHCAGFGSFFAHFDDTIVARVVFGEKRVLVLSCGRRDLTDRGLLVVSDFEQQTSAGTQKAVGLQDELPNARQPVIAPIQCPERLV
jgi:hypothetical protein